MKSLVASLVLVLAGAAMPAGAASLEPAPSASDSTAIPSLDLDASGGAVFEIPATTFT